MSETSEERSYREYLEGAFNEVPFAPPASSAPRRFTPEEQAQQVEHEALVAKADYRRQSLTMLPGEQEIEQRRIARLFAAAATLRNLDTERAAWLKATVYDYLVLHDEGMLADEVVRRFESWVLRRLAGDPHDAREQTP